MKKICTVIFLLWLLNVHAEDSVLPLQFNFSLGSLTTSFAENPDKLEATDGSTTTTSTPYSGSSTAMPLELGIEYFPTIKRSYFLSGAGPVMATTPDRYYSVLTGINFYFNQIGSQANVKDFTIKMTILPKIRYYAGPSIGVGYFIYNTKSATKNDVLFQIGGQGGFSYSLNTKWSLRGELGFSRSIGVLVNATTIRIMLGASYSFFK